MRKFLGFLVLVGLCIVVILTAFYVNKSIYLPYVTPGGVVWTDFYTDMPVKFTKKTVKQFSENHEWYDGLLAGLDSSPVDSDARIYLDYLNSMGAGAIVRVDIKGSESRALIIEGVYKKQRTCLILRLNKDSSDVGYSLETQSSSQIHYVGGVLANLCNSDKYFDTKLKKVGLSSYVKYSLLNCFGSCEKVGYVFYKNIKLNKEEAQTIIGLLQVKLQEQEQAYHSLTRPLDQIKVNITRVIGSDNVCFVAFTYKNPVMGAIRSYAQFDCKTDYKLVSINKKTALTVELEPVISQLIAPAK